MRVPINNITTSVLYVRFEENLEFFAIIIQLIVSNLANAWAVHFMQVT